MWSISVLLCCLVAASEAPRADRRRLEAYNVQEVAGLPKQPLPKLLAATDAAHDSLAPPGALPRRQPPAAASRALVVARERRLTTDYAQLAKLVAGDAAASDYFGFSLAIDGDTVVIGAYGAGPGVAYILRASDGVQLAKLMAADAASGDEFGWSVAINGDTVVVGARQDDDGGSNSGSVYVFRTSDGGATYGQVAKLTAADAAANDWFGYSVAIDSDTVVVAAVRKDGNTGAVYVFRTTDGGATYGQVAKLAASDAAAGDYFGDSVAIDGDTIVVGADGDDDAGTRSGSAYVFSTTAALGSDSATRAGGTLATALLAFAATALAL